MFLRILILFLISLSLNAAEMVWDEDSANRTKNVSDKEYSQALVNYLATHGTHGEREKQVFLGLMYLEGQGVKQDYLEASRLFKLSADQGNSNAQNNLGNLYYDGHGVKQDYQEAARLFKLSADQGNASAQLKLGWL